MEPKVPPNDQHRRTQIVKFSERHELNLLTTPEALFGGFETQNVMILLMLKVNQMNYSTVFKGNSGIL